MYLILAMIFFVVGWILVGFSLYFCNETSQRTLDTLLIWSLLAVGLMGNVYAAIFMGMARSVKSKEPTIRAKLIINGKTKWLDEGTLSDSTLNK